MGKTLESVKDYRVWNSDRSGFDFHLNHHKVYYLINYVTSEKLIFH